ncbi:MAG: DUF2851 family protein [Planctomycetota bacterium]
MTFQSLDNIPDIFPKSRQYQSSRNKTLPSPLRVRAWSAFLCRDKKTELVLEKITEKFIHYLWAEQPLENLHYRTADNKEIKIVFTGLWNSNPGPDFTDAVIYIDNQLYKGDIEIHLYSSDWTRHQHHLNNKYNNLILHITLWDDNEKLIKLNNGREIPQMILSELLREKLEDIDKLLELDIAPKQDSYFTSAGRCYSYIKQAPNQKTIYFLEGAGESRLLRKIDNFNNRLSKSKSDYDEVLYQGIMSALGYKNNQLSFLQLSEIVPYQKILKLTGQYSEDKQSLAIQSLLLTAVGLLPETTDNLNQATKYYLKYLNEFSCVSKKSPGVKLDWQIPGGRPANSPYRRIAGISYLLGGKVSLFTKIVEVISNQPAEKIRKELIQLLSVPATGYWATRSTFDSKTFSKELALIGKERADAIILNIIIPLVLIYSQSEKNSALQKTILDLYRTYPKLMDNYYTRFMNQRLFKSDKKIFLSIIKTASVQQGLIEIFTDFCKKGYEGCENCGLLKFLKQ